MIREYILRPMDFRVLEWLARLKAGSFEDKEKSVNAQLWVEGADDKEKNFNGHLRGVIGEYVVAKLWGGFYEPVPQKYGDGHEPDVWFGNKGCAVKCTEAKYRTPYYMIQHRKQIVKAPILALTTFDGHVTVKAYGFIDQQRFWDENVVREFGQGPTMTHPFNGARDEP